ncbi:MAG TPA: glycosyltransferase family 2 protein [Verrucomicrobiae bacterium]|nr:glycosyltransferase family 2 protein [Verrucomicrobiae bacterium]
MSSKATFNELPLITAVVVTYRPNGALLENLRGIISQVPTVIVVDNGSDGPSAKVVEAAGNLAGIQLIRNGANLGIATALNIGIRQALRAGYQWVATFDQDSAIPDHFFQELVRTYQACPATEKVGMVTPGKWSVGSTSPTQPVNTEEPLFSFVPAAITSGSLIRAEVFEPVGFYDDELFIDYVDADFCLRMRKHGFKILKATQVVLEHELGTKQTRNLLGYLLSFRIHTAWRYYYNIRNRLLLYRRYVTTSPYWVLCDAAWLVLEFGRITFLEKGHGPKLQAVIRGLMDGLCGRTGRHPNYPPNG